MEPEEDALSDSAASIGEELTVVDELDNSAMVLMDSAVDQATYEVCPQPYRKADALSKRVKHMIQKTPARRGRKAAAPAAEAQTEVGGESAHAAALQMSLPHHNWLEQKLQQHWAAASRQSSQAAEASAASASRVQLVQDAGDSDSGDDPPDGADDQGFILGDAQFGEDTSPQAPAVDKEPAAAAAKVAAPTAEAERSRSTHSFYDKARLPLKKRRIVEDSASRSPPLSMRRKEAPVLAVPPVCREDDPTQVAAAPDAPPPKEDPAAAAALEKSRQQASKLLQPPSLAQLPPLPVPNAFLEAQRQQQKLLAQRIHPHGGPPQMPYKLAPPAIAWPAAGGLGLPETTPGTGEVVASVKVKRKYQRRKPQQQQQQQHHQHQLTRQKQTAGAQSHSPAGVGTLSIDLTREEEARQNHLSYYQRQQRQAPPQYQQLGGRAAAATQLLEPAGLFLGRSAPGFAVPNATIVKHYRPQQQSPMGAAQQLGSSSSSLDWREPATRLLQPPPMMQQQQQRQQQQQQQLPINNNVSNGTASTIWHSFPSSGAFQRSHFVGPPAQGYMAARQLQQPQQQQQQQHQHHPQQQFQDLQRYYNLQQHRADQATSSSAYHPTQQPVSVPAGRVLHPTPIRASPGPAQQQQQQPPQMQQLPSQIPMPQLQQQPQHRQSTSADQSEGSQSSASMQHYQRAMYQQQLLQPPI